MGTKSAAMSDEEEGGFFSNDDGTEEDDPTIGERAQTACIRILLAPFFAAAGAYLLYWNIQEYIKLGDDYGGSHTLATVVGISFGGCILCSIGSFCCLSPLADSIDAITDMIPCLPSCIEETIDGMADVIVAVIAAFCGAGLTLFVLGCVLAVEHPMAAAVMFGIVVLLCCFIGCVCNGSEKKPKRKKAKDGGLDEEMMEPIDDES